MTPFTPKGHRLPRPWACAPGWVPTTPKGFARKSDEGNPVSEHREPEGPGEEDVAKTLLGIHVLRRHEQTQGRELGGGSDSRAWPPAGQPPREAGGGSPQWKGGS